ncbi:MAG TPA: hypothetical protein VGG46_05340 [Terriglobales bacterium]|jgi:hypothetical protein
MLDTQMANGNKLPIIGLIILIAAGVGAVFLRQAVRRKPVILRGATITENADPQKQLPISDVVVSTTNDKTPQSVKSDSSGLFELTLPTDIRRGTPLTLQFFRAGYFPYELKDYVSDKLFIVHMKSMQPETRPQPSRPGTSVGNVLVKYSIKDSTSANVGSAVRTFEVKNVGNVPCKGKDKDPCSPDGKWKAAKGSVSLDAGEGNLFQNVRASCIAGPCPFTRIEGMEQRESEKTITVSALDWSDTAVFLVEAEVIHPMVSNAGRESYPVIFGRALNFTLPLGAQGVSIQAELNSETIIFPLGPNLLMSWANCNARVSNDQTRVYRCELKPGYTFR